MIASAPLLETVASLLLGPALYATEDPCSRYDTAVVVDVQARSLRLCELGATQANYPVALGGGGIGKRTMGDRKTPLGSYALGEPRLSHRFGVFIPISYPTAAQRRRGFTGSEIGIHGPQRRFEWAGSWNTHVNWTDGCIALGTLDEAMKVATFVQEHAPSVFIR
jgi:murein L,D-transpeptidase YafK